MTFKKATQTMVITPASTKTICVPDQARTSSGTTSRSRSQSPNRTLAVPNEPACSPVELHKARIESTFKRIEFIDFKEKPACLIVVDVRFIYNKNYQIRSANIEVTFSKDQNSSADGSSFPRTTDTFGPMEFFGDTESISLTQNVDLTTPGTIAQCGLPTAKYNSLRVQTQKQKWHIQGTRGKEGSGQSYNWSIFDNDLSDFDSFPRAVTLWMIVEHDNMPFYAEMCMDGKLRGHMAMNAASKVRKALVQEEFVPEFTLDSIINAAHNIWSVSAAKRMADSKFFTPSACTCVPYDKEKLRAALTSGLWNEDIMKCATDNVSEIEEDVKSVHLHLSCELKRSLFGIKRKAIAVC